MSNVSVCILVALIIIGIGFSIAQVKYEAVKKYYPNLTFKEYLILQDKIRIIPNED